MQNEKHFLANLFCMQFSYKKENGAIFLCVEWTKSCPKMDNNAQTISLFFVFWNARVLPFSCIPLLFSVTMATFEGESNLATIANTLSDRYYSEEIRDEKHLSSLQVFCSQILQLQTPEAYRIQNRTMNIAMCLISMLMESPEISINMTKLALDILSAPPPSSSPEDEIRKAFWEAKNEAIGFIGEYSSEGLEFVPLSMLTSTSEVLKKFINERKEEGVVVRGGSPGEREFLMSAMQWFRSWYKGGEYEWIKKPATFQQFGLGGCFLSSLVDDLMFYLPFSGEDSEKILKYDDENGFSIDASASELVGLILFISSSGEDGCDKDVYPSAIAALEGLFDAFKTTKSMEEARRVYGAISCLCEWEKNIENKEGVDLVGTKTALSSMIQKLVVPLLSECSEFKREFPFVIAQGLKVLPFALGALSDKEIVDLCLSFLEESSVLVRLSALISLGKMVDAVERERYEAVFPESTVEKIYGVVSILGEVKNYPTLDAFQKLTAEALVRSLHPTRVSSLLVSLATIYSKMALRVKGIIDRLEKDAWDEIQEWDGGEKPYVAKFSLLFSNVVPLLDPHDVLPALDLLIPSLKIFYSSLDEDYTFSNFVRVLEAFFSKLTPPYPSSLWELFLHLSQPRNENLEELPVGKFLNFIEKMMEDKTTVSTSPLSADILTAFTALVRKGIDSSNPCRLIGLVGGAMGAMSKEQATLFVPLVEELVNENLSFSNMMGMGLGKVFYFAPRELIVGEEGGFKKFVDLFLESIAPVKKYKSMDGRRKVVLGASRLLELMEERDEKFELLYKGAVSHLVKLFEDRMGLEKVNAKGEKEKGNRKRKRERWIQEQQDEKNQEEEMCIEDGSDNGSDCDDQEDDSGYDSHCDDREDVEEEGGVGEEEVMAPLMYFFAQLGKVKEAGGEKKLEELYEGLKAREKEAFDWMVSESSKDAVKG